VQNHVLPLVYAGIDETVQGLFDRDSSGLIVFASLLAIWEVSGAVRACIGALTRVYDAKETRPRRGRARGARVRAPRPMMTYFYVAAILLLVGIEVDERLRKDAKEAERGMHEVVRELV